MHRLPMADPLIGRERHPVPIPGPAELPGLPASQLKHPQLRGRGAGQGAEQPQLGFYQVSSLPQSVQSRENWIKFNWPCAAQTFYKI